MKHSHTHGVVRDLLLRLAAALLLNLYCEILSRRSLGDAFGFIADHPAAFLAGAGILFMTMAVTMLFRRRGYAFAVVSVIWVLLGAANFVVMSMRSMPLTAGDIGAVFSCLSIIPVYLSTFEIVLVCAGLIALILLAVLLVRKARRYDCRLSARCAVSAAGLGLAALMLWTGFLTDALSIRFSNLPDAYGRYGFAYCFTTGLMRRGIQKPPRYSRETVESVTSSLPDEKAEQTPNIIFLQLESFFDTARLPGMEFSINPVPVFTELKQNNPSGYLTVPYIGSGTANIEFEVLTGMDLAGFGPGEYPYKTVLKQTACESAAFILRDLGYRAHALHNNGGTFYNRINAFASLGFDTFTPLEYMENVTYNPLGWAKDESLLGPIFDCLNETGDPDFIFAISVQGHGKYPTGETAAEASGSKGHTTGKTEAALTLEQQQALTIDVTGESCASAAAQYRYYAQQISEMDAFVGSLLQALSEYPEPVLLAVYGDHLPALPVDETAGGNMCSEYVLWSNYGLAVPDEDLCSYELLSHVLKTAGISAGILPRFHQTDGTETALETLEYDMLYGRHYAGGAREKTDLRLGVNEIRVTGSYEKDGFLYLEGAHFTPFSTVLANGKKTETEYLSSSLLRVSRLPEAEDTAVAQINSEGTILGEYRLQGQ